MKNRTAKFGHPEKRVTPKTIDYLFDEFSIFYGSSWTTQSGFDDTWEDTCKRSWYEILKSMDFDDFGLAMRFLKSDENKEFLEFPPKVFQFKNLPDQIRAKSIPSMFDCFQAAIDGEWSFHPIVFHAAKACDIFWLRRANENEARKRFSGKYAEAKEKFLRGDILDAPHIALGKKKIEDEEMEIFDESSVQFLVEKRARELKNSSEFESKRMSAKDYLNRIRSNLGSSAKGTSHD